MTVKRKTDAERFWQLAIPEPNTGCFLWLGSTVGGYGRFGIGSRTDKTRRIVVASRFICELVNGPLQDGQFALHKCDNPSCVNPDHLYVGSRSQNMRDAYARGQKRPVNVGWRRRNKAGQFLDGILS